MGSLFYKLDCIPDLELAKYQALGEQGVEGAIKRHNNFLRQWQRYTENTDVVLHLYIFYQPCVKTSDKFQIYFSIGFSDDAMAGELNALVAASPLSPFYSLKNISEDEFDLNNLTYNAVSYVKKKEQVKNSDNNCLFVVSGWKNNEECRLYEMLQVMMALKEPAVYCVDFSGNVDVPLITHSLKKPVDILRKKLHGSNEDKIQLRDNVKNEPRDFAAEEALKVYEEFLDSLAKTPYFQANIQVYSNKEPITRFILGAACGEALQEGNCDIISKTGVFMIKNREPEQYSELLPESLEYWPTTFSMEEFSPFFRLPALYDGEFIELEKETQPKLGDEGFYLGKNSSFGPVYLSSELLMKHMFVCGVPGAGKTNTMLHIANSLWHNTEIVDGQQVKRPIPFLVLEPAKREYRELCYFDIPELIIFSPSAQTDFPITINPFEFPKGLTLSEHITRLCQVFEGAFPILPPAPFILDRAIEAVYVAHGWKPSDINMGVKDYPTMSELYEQFKKEMDKTNYASEIQGNIQSVLEMRIGSLLRREMKDIFDVKKSVFAPEEWLTKPVIIELEALGENIANFMTLLLCTLIRETLKVSAGQLPKDMYSKKQLKHVIFIEEAHNLIAPSANVANGEESNPKIAATAYIVKMLAEVRALREGIIIADQLPTAMAPEVIKNTNVKLMHRMTSADDRELMGSTMSASGLQMEQVATYLPGQALISYEGLLRPFEMKIHALEKHGDAPTDHKLYEIMINKKGAFFELCREREEEKKKHLILKIKSTLNDEKEMCRQMTEYPYEQRSPKQIQEFLESNKDMYLVVDLLRQQYIREAEKLSELFIENEKKKTLLELIDNCGQLLKRQMQQTVLMCIDRNLL